MERLARRIQRDEQEGLINRREAIRDAVTFVAAVGGMLVGRAIQWAEDSQTQAQLDSLTAQQNGLAKALMLVDNKDEQAQTILANAELNLNERLKAVEQK